jgi:CRP-like cAMP-binding protein
MSTQCLLIDEGQSTGGAQLHNDLRKVKRSSVLYGGHDMAHQLDVEDLLAHAPLFRDLSASRITRIAQAARQVRLSRHSFAFRRGEQPNGVYVIVIGSVKLAIPSVEGHEKVLEFFGPGDAFGEAVMLLEQPYMVDAQALADTLLIWIDKREILAALEENPAFSRHLLEKLAHRWHALVEDIEAANLQSAAQRLVNFLLSQPRDGDCTRFPFSKSIVASKLGLSPETLSRLLNQFSRAGLITVHGRMVIIHQPDAFSIQRFAA